MQPLYFSILGMIADDSPARKSVTNDGIVEDNDFQSATWDETEEGGVPSENLANPRNRRKDNSFCTR